MIFQLRYAIHSERQLVEWLEGDGAAARETMRVIEAAREARTALGPGTLTIMIRIVDPGSANLALEPWIVEKSTRPPR